ncbi:MAG: sulfatase [Planctomycetes bacterium]|nr:sulfatase [Planctomycetota bacterium]
MVRLTLALILPLFAASALAQAKLSGSRPNIIFLFSDDHAAHAISAYGSRINETPNIDRIAKGGVLFRNNFCGNSICGPSRATILTGKHCHVNGFMRNGNRFDPDQVTMPKLLQKAGYQTAMIGKWHLESDPQGFDHWMILPGQGQYYNPDFITPTGRVRIEGHATNITADLALEWLEGRDADKPFLLMCQHKAPHRNWMAAPEELGLYRDRDIPEPATLFDDYAGRLPGADHTEMTIARHMYLHYDLLVPPTEAERAAGFQGPDNAFDGIMRRMTESQRATWDAAYAAENEAFRQNEPQGKDRVRWYYQRYIKNYLRCVAGVDRNIGRVLDWLDAHPEVKQNTVVVYSSDQGFYLGDHGWYDKRWMYEESFRMPLVVQWPEHIAAGVEVAQLTQNIDFAPTFLDLAGVEVPAAVQGESLVPLLEGKRPDAWRDALYFHYYESHAVHMVPAHYGVRTDRYKLVHYYEPEWNGWELFDLVKDPDELHNLADEPSHGAIRAALQKRLVELRKQYDDTTGVLGSFELTAGIARVQPTSGGQRIWANATGGYALMAGDPGGRKLTTTMAPVAGRQQQNGFVLLSGGDPRQQLVRAGIEFGARRLVVVGPGGMKVRQSAKVDWDGSTQVEVSVTIDLAGHRLVAAALGQRVEATLPADWTELTAWGYGASNAETEFTEMVIE